MLSGPWLIRMREQTSWTEFDIYGDIKAIFNFSYSFEVDKNIHNENVTHFSLSHKRRENLNPLGKPAFYTDQPSRQCLIISTKLSVGIFVISST